jgi:hypothetical protein
MQFTKRLRAGVLRGDITCSVRIWASPHVKRGGRYSVDGGVIEVDSIERIEFSDITAKLARESGFGSVVDLLKIAKHGPGEKVYLVRFHPVRDTKSAEAKKSAALPAKPKKSSTTQRKTLLAILKRLPEADGVVVGTHIALEVRRKRFGWFLDDHHGDGRVALNCKGSAALHDMLKELAPAQFHVPKYVGNKGWIGLWLDVPKLNWSAVELAVREAYLIAAPKTLARELV